MTPLVSGPSHDLTLAEAMNLLPKKSMGDHPQAFQDGGGLFSVPDWSYPRTGHGDIFGDLRHKMFKLILDNSCHKRLLCHFHMHSAEPPLSAQELAPFRQILEDWMISKDLRIDWTVREHQPMHLHLMQEFSRFMQDEDTALFFELD